jgi:hypothetical protein
MKPLGQFISEIRVDIPTEAYLKVKCSSNDYLWRVQR